MIQLRDQAIQTALIGNWNEAILINQSILEVSPTDINTLNRLGFAYGELGNIAKAKETYQQVLKLDPFNPIATKNLKRLDNLHQDNKTTCPPPTISNKAFIEEIGKTKIIDLINTAQPDTLSKLRIGEIMQLCIKRFKIFVLNEQKQYIGMLPDNIGARLITLIEGGNEYDVYIKFYTLNKVSIFIKETKRADKFKNQASFLTLEKTKFIYGKKG